ncbi:unnamed protein product [Ectocarpus sp. 8 AP-2014]
MVVLVVVVFTYKIVPVSAQYLLLSVLVQLTQTPSVVTSQLPPKSGEQLSKKQSGHKIFLGGCYRCYSAHPSGPPRGRGRGFYNISSTVGGLRNGRNVGSSVGLTKAALEFCFSRLYELPSRQVR